MAKNLDIFNSIVKELDLFYVDTIDPNKTVREGIDAMLYSLDPYTEYYPEDDQDELEQMLKNSYGGIGSVITYSRKTQYTTISEPYEGMPAAEAGLKAGDILLELDGQDLKGNPGRQHPVARTGGHQLQTEGAAARREEAAGVRHRAPFHRVAHYSLLRNGGRQHRLHQPQHFLRQPLRKSSRKPSSA